MLINCMCHVNHYKNFGLGSKSISEVSSHIVYIPDNILILFYRWLYIILCLTLKQFPTKFLMKVFCNIFFNNVFHFGVRQRIPLSVLYKIHNIYPHISAINKGMSIFHKLRVK